MSHDTAPVRPGEELDVERLREYLAGRLEGARESLALEQFPGGHSNLTYLVKSGGREYVLRRAPLGPVAPKAHDMARECRILEAVSPHFPQAPKPYLLCEDPAIIGATFFLMERRHGAIIRLRVPDEIASQPDHQSRISRAVLRCLADLHAIDLPKNNLLHLGKPEGFVERQVKGWIDRWDRAKLDPLPEMDAAAQWLAENVPPSQAATLVHNDYKLDNVMLNPANLDRIEAVLDWEMTAIGDPMIDVGLTLCYWTIASAPDIAGSGVPGITSQPGWFSRAQFLETYEEFSGRRLEHVRFHELLAVFKLAVILQQIYYRFAKGQTKDERFRDFHKRVAALAQRAGALL